MKQVRILNTFYDSGRPKYLAGQLYPITDDTLRQVAKGNGVEVDEPTEAELQAQAEADELAKQQAEQQAATEAAQREQDAAQAEADQAAAAAQLPPAPASAPVAPAAPTPARKRAG